MSKFPRLSASKIIKILVEDFGVQVSRQAGSHIVLHKFADGRKIVTVVPMQRGQGWDYFWYSVLGRDQQRGLSQKCLI